MHTVNRRRLLPTLALAVLLLAALCACGATHRNAAGEAYHRIVVLGDPHLPGANLAHKEQVRDQINTWEDVEMVVAVGDICAIDGNDSEYEAAGKFFAGLRKPLFPITGNHDYIYPNISETGGGYVPAPRPQQEAKLGKFRQTFGLSHHYYDKWVGPYLLLFCSIDHDQWGTGMAEPQMDWLRRQLALHRHTPTIIFFHAPLNGTQYDFKRYVNKPHSVAQPEAPIRELLAANPQVFLWVSGHTHTPPTEPSFAAPVNRYLDQVTNIHNKDMKGETIWTNSLYLYPDRVEVRTFNHNTGQWLDEIDRTIARPSR